MIHLIYQFIFYVSETYDNLKASALCKVTWKIKSSCTNKNKMWKEAFRYPVSEHLWGGG